MQLQEIFYYVLFTVSVATYARTENPSRELSERHTEKRISKREAAIFVIDSIPGESATSNKPKRFYKRISKQRFQSKPNYGRSRSRARHGPSSQNSSKPHKAYKVKKIKPIYSSSSSAKKHVPKSPSNSPWQSKSKRGPWSSKRPPKQPGIAPPSQFGARPQRKPSVVYSPLEQEPMGFAEPPADYRPMKHLEVPVDSYGNPLRVNINDPRLKESTDIYENYDLLEAHIGPDYVNLNDQPQKDNNMAFSNNFQSLAHPSVFAKDMVTEEMNMNTMNSYVPSKFNDMVNKNKKRVFFNDMQKVMNKPWTKPTAEEDKVLVGGQYAEPPGRYVPMYHANDHMFFEDRDRFSIGNVDTDQAATVSPYINYKNSNLAFSPQNLNDAFSVDK